jgi:hypothetical protein
MNKLQHQFNTHKERGRGRSDVYFRGISAIISQISRNYRQEQSLPFSEQELDEKAKRNPESTCYFDKAD